VAGLFAYSLGNTAGGDAMFLPEILNLETTTSMQSFKWKATIRTPNFH
jgi:hypothetical protein